MTTRPREVDFSGYTVIDSADTAEQNKNYELALVAMPDYFDALEEGLSFTLQEARQQQPIILHHQHFIYKAHYFTIFYWDTFDTFSKPESASLRKWGDIKEEFTAEEIPIVRGVAGMIGARPRIFNDGSINVTINTVWPKHAKREVKKQNFVNLVKLCYQTFI